ncbi:MAG TPA: sterol desaturase family protein [Polyangiales bacterium]|nr:sterol desaturase family protein [Polyangiales bacterium]
MNTNVFESYLVLLRERLGNLPLIALGGVVLFVTLLLSTPALERLSPEAWPESASERQTFIANMRYVYLSGVTEIIGRVLTTGSIVLVAICVGLRVDSALLRGFGPVIRQPRWLIWIEIVLLSDVAYYWTHRLAHTVPVLWKFHSVHHSSEHMSFAAAARAHPVESYALVLNTLPLFALGFPVDMLLPLAPFTIVYGMLIHSQLRFNPRRFCYFINSPAYHHWHHSRKYSGNGSNFAGYFPMFDVLFGTFDFPKEAPEKVGVEDPNMPQTLLGQLAYPFRRRTRSHESSRASWRKSGAKGGFEKSETDPKVRA